MMLKKCICRLKSLNTSEHREKLLKLKKYSGKICINWVVHWYVQNLSFNKPNRNLNDFPLFLLLILFKFNLSTVPSLPFLFFALCLKSSTKSYSRILCGYGGKCSYSSEMMLKCLGVTRHEVCNVLSNDSKKK